MSAFLGPIHSWLYNKIRIQDNITETIISSLDKEKSAEVTDYINNKTEVLPNGNLEDIIDTSDIHGWLQDKVTIVETRYVNAIKFITENKLADTDQLKKTVSSYGKTLSSQYNVTTPEECFKLLSDIALDGMPCDHINSISENGNDRLQYIRKDSFRDELWKQSGLDSKLYYELRIAFINGVLAYTPFRLKMIDNITFYFYSDSITLMMSEHQYILRMVQVIRAASYRLMTSSEIDYDDLGNMIMFIRNYADKHHHGKEEKILFKQMTDNLGKMGDNLIRHGMLVEHDLGRLYMKELEDAIESFKHGNDISRLDIIANAISYTHLIARHIEKEDDLIYSFGQKNLSAEIMKQVDEDTIIFENQATENSTQNKYIDLLKTLESKYI